MPFFSNKNNQVIPELPRPPPPPPSALRHHLYSEYNRLVPSPPLPQFTNNRQSFYSKNTPQKCKEFRDVEKYNHHRRVYADIIREENKSKISCSRLMCCICFPCLPMWTRTMCCFIFLALCSVIGLFVIFVFTFKRPDVTFNGNGKSLSSSSPEDFLFEYSILNENFFPINFDSIKAVIYYPTPNKTMVGVAEVQDLILGPQSVTNITFPVRLMSNDYDRSSSSSEEEEKGVNEKAFKEMVINSCGKQEDTGGNTIYDVNKDIVVSFDLMSTIQIYNHSIMTLAFTDQKARMSCGKLQFLNTKNANDG